MQASTSNDDSGLGGVISVASVIVNSVNDTPEATGNTITGELRFLNAPNFENALDDGADNTYNLSVQLSDGRTVQDTQSVVVMVNDVNEAPSLTAVQLTASEGFVGDIGSVIMTDPDAGDKLTLNIVGGSAQAYFSVDSFTGSITQESSLVAGLYTLEVQLFDASGMSTNATLQIRIDAAPPSLQAGNATTSHVDVSIDESILGANTSNESNHLPSDILGQTSYKTPDQDSMNTLLTTTATKQEQFLKLHNDSVDVGQDIDSLFAENHVQSLHPKAPSAGISDTDANNSVSRGYSVVLKLLFDEADEQFDELGNTLASILDRSSFSITFTPDMTSALSSLHSDGEKQQQQADERLELIITTGTVATVTLTVGFISWLLQSGSLLATTLSTAPLWRSIDPIPVLHAGKDGDEQQRIGTDE